MNAIVRAVTGPFTPGLRHVVDALTAANVDCLPGRQRRFGQHALPSREALTDLVDDLRAVLFPVHFGPPDLTEEGMRYYVRQRLNAAILLLQEQVHCGLLFVCEHPSSAGECPVCTRRAGDVTREFVARLPHVRTLLGSDVRAAYEGDPAATSSDEAVFCYPGINAVIHYRLAHELYDLGVPLTARIITEIAHSVTGIDIHPGARIGGSFFIDHGTGVVIGETCVIGARVRLYQGVTLGARSFPIDAEGRPVKGTLRHTIVEDDVTIYSNATILGRITIGRGSSIGGNVWLTRSVPPGSRISQARVRDELFDGGMGI